MYKVLIVDDERIILNGIQNMIQWDCLSLSVCGACENAVEALDAMIDGMPDILITDIKLPGMSGIELIARAQQMNPIISSIIISGYDEFDFARAALKLGVKEYLLKPCKPEELEHALKNCIDVIEVERNQINVRYEQRMKRIDDLEKTLEELKSHNITAITEAQIAELRRNYGDPSILREAFTRLVIKGSMVGYEPRETLSILSQIYTDEEQTNYITKYLNQSKSNDHRSDFIITVCNYVNDNYQNEDLSLKYIADHVVYMNDDYLSKTFLKQMGEKFSTYLFKKRMEEACIYIRVNPELTIREVSERIGLGNNPQYFSMLFKKYTGMTVGQYKSKM